MRSLEAADWPAYSQNQSQNPLAGAGRTCGCRGPTKASTAEVALYGRSLEYVKRRSILARRLLAARQPDASRRRIRGSGPIVRATRFMESSNHYEISTDRSRLDIALIHAFLHSSYWAKGISREIVERSIENSLCFGAYFGRRTSWLCPRDFRFRHICLHCRCVCPAEHRGRGVAKLLMRSIIEHPDLHGLRRLLLITRDAHGLYAHCGFQPLPNPENFMTIHLPNVYLKASNA